MKQKFLDKMEQRENEWLVSVRENPSGIKKKRLEKALDKALEW